MLCDLCRSSLTPSASPRLLPQVERVLAPWDYEGAIRSLILSLKLRGLRRAAVPLAEGMAAFARAEGLVGAMLTWVPARRADIRRRGFDHAHVLAGRLSRELGLPARALLARAASPPDQTSLGAPERRNNLEGAFVARACPSQVVLVDDLVTTGTTARVCSAALRDAGAGHVEVLAAALA
jgi:ComF family protein